MRWRGRLSLISVGLVSRALKTKKKIGAVPMRGRLCLRGVNPRAPWPVDEPGRIGRAGVVGPLIVIFGVATWVTMPAAPFPTG